MRPFLETVNDLQRETIAKLRSTLELSHYTGIIIRKDGQDHHFQADWLRDALKRLCDEDEVMGGNKIVKERGLVKWFNEDKGFGFLVVDGYPKDIFIHKQQLEKSGVSKLQVGDKVMCVVNQSPKGHFATALSKE